VAKSAHRINVNEGSLLRLVPKGDSLNPFSILQIARDDSACFMGQSGPC